MKRRKKFRKFYQTVRIIENQPGKEAKNRRHRRKRCVNTVLSICERDVSKGIRIIYTVCVFDHFRKGTRMMEY
jgi:hypothetical protein